MTQLATPVPELADVLHALGHDCPNGCARASDELGATVWLTRTGLPASGRVDPTLVVVDSSASLAPPNRSYQLIRFVDRCARTDGVRVRERRASDVLVTPTRQLARCTTPRPGRGHLTVTPTHEER